MKVAIIGANGFIGTRLVELFHLTGRHTVVTVVRRAASLALTARFALDSRIGDALSVPSLSAALAGCDAVVHTAIGDPHQIQRMPTVLCLAAARAGVRRVVYLSSASVHGQAPVPGTSEDSPLHCHHAIDYNNAKVRAERIFFWECARHNLDGFALRPSVVFGPRSRWITDLASDLRRNQAWLLGDGEGICNTLYVDNLVEAVAKSLAAPAEAAGAYLVGDAECGTWGNFYRQVATSLEIDCSTIHRVIHLPNFQRTRQENVARLIASPAMQTLLPAVPSRLKQMGKQFIASVVHPAAVADSWQIQPAPTPRITQELALLQQCRWVLSSDRATNRLGYRPVVNFSTAIERSLAWFAFAEGRL
ncbi:NAD-dependent epimerase/dehydratase family protein [Oleiharenicola lentus]|uniref:NAD-dependent epimerase/dehydratase family protein n=1 Tax=Oleiharenicola lentus TaxID=2508720 RepID=UPI003F67F87F